MSIILKAINKRFGQHQVLKGVDLTLPSGQVTVLLGANGAGKSTLVKILAGANQADSGEVWVDGQVQTLTSPQQANAQGIVTVYQIIDDNLVPNLTVVENLLLDRLCGGGLSPWLKRAQMRQQAQQMAARVGLTLDVDLPLNQVGQADRQLLAIARALSHQPKLLILDEPTSTLSDAEAQRLFALIDSLKAQGVAILYISHRMNDIRRLADRLCSLRDGVIVDEQDGSQPLNYQQAVDAMLGQVLSHSEHHSQHPGIAVIEFRQAVLAAGKQPFDLTIYQDQVTVLTGLLSAGAEQLLEVLFGLRPLHSGEVRVHGKRWLPRRPSDAINAGIHMLGDDRKLKSLLPNQNLQHNTSLPFLRRFSRGGFIHNAAEQQAVRAAFAQTQVKYQHLGQTMQQLSGGNQQKVMLARWLLAPCQVLLLNEPFQGIDIAARQEISALLRAQSAGRTTLVVCTDLEEALALGDRLVVFNHQQLAGVHRVDNLSIEQVVTQIAATDVAA